MGGAAGAPPARSAGAPQAPPAQRGAVWGGRRRRPPPPAQRRPCYSRLTPLRNFASAALGGGARRLAHRSVAAHRCVACISQESPPSTSKHALRHHRLRAAQRRAPNRTDWLGASGRRDEICCGCCLVACSSWPPAVGAGAGCALSSSPHRSLTNQLACALLRIFLPLRGAGRLSAQKASLRGGRAPKRLQVRTDKYKKVQLAAAVLEIKEP